MAYTQRSTGAGLASSAGLTINFNTLNANEQSDWAVAAVVVYNRTLNASEYNEVENWLSVAYNLTATISARNALNHVNYSAPIGTLNSPFFGQSLSSAGGGGMGGPGGGGGGGGFGGPGFGGGGAAGNRKIELQVRFQF